MKWIGGVLFILLTTWIGFEWSFRLKNRPKHIRQLKNTLNILEAEMLYSQRPLQDVFEIISKQVPKPTGSFFQSLSEELKNDSNPFIEIWCKYLDLYISRSALGENEKEILKQFGQTLGQHDFTQQQKHIQLTATYLGQELREALEKDERYGNMTKLLGFLAGLFIVILLI